jgi:hypothetical protein
MVVRSGDVVATRREPKLVRATNASGSGMSAAKRYNTEASEKMAAIDCDGAQASRRVRKRLKGVKIRPLW